MMIPGRLSHSLGEGRPGPLAGRRPPHRRGWQPRSAVRVGVDVAMGGKDKTVLARRYGTWLAPLEKHEGSSTPQGEQTAGLVLKALTEGGYANIDVIGVGGQVYGLCKAQTPNARAVVYSQPSFGKDKTGTLEFVNIRAQAYWSFREALDPTNPNPIALPPDRELRADLTAPRFKLMVGGIQIESKVDVKKRLGRSTDCGDAAVLAFWDDPRANWARAIGQPFDMPKTLPPAKTNGAQSQFGQMRTEMDLERMRRQERIWAGQRGGRRKVTR
jgi:hypothetical protein